MDNSTGSNRFDTVGLFRKVQDDTARSIRVAMPARIESYDYKTQKANVIIDMKELSNDKALTDYPVINSLPVIFPISGGASLTFPVLRGDGCLVVFADRDISNWLLGAKDQKPNTSRTHDLSDAVVILGLNPFNNNFKAKNNTDVLLTYSNSEIELKPDGVININSGKEINIKTKNININVLNDAIITVDNSATINCKNMNVTASENIEVTCKNATVTASDAVQVNCKNTAITASENITLNAVDAIVTATGNVTIECVDSTITASGTIKTTAPTFEHNGDLKVSGNVEIAGYVAGNAGGNLTVNNGITNSGGTITTSGKVIDTHTHLYLKPEIGSSPTVATPDQTGGMS